MNISEATRKALAKYPFLERYMALGVVNNRGLARLLLPDVTKELETSPNIQSVVTALRRKTIEKTRPERTRLDRILGGSEVNLKYDMAAISLSLGTKDLEKTKNRLLTEGAYIQLQGMESLTIIADEPAIQKVKERMKENVLEYYPNLSIVVVKSPPEITRTPGVLAHFSNILSLEKINVVEMMSSHAETAFIVEEKDALRTIEVLRLEIKRARQ